MAAFLKNLPTIDSENFSRFKPDTYKTLPKKQSLFACAKDPNESIIINHSYNLLIQFLEKQTIYTHEKASKRDYSQIQDQQGQEDDECTQKKRKFQTH